MRALAPEGLPLRVLHRPRKRYRVEFRKFAHKLFVTLSEAKDLLFAAGRALIDAQGSVKAIPVTEAREYVQAILRHANVYRQLYGTP